MSTRTPAKSIDLGVLQGAFTTAREALTGALRAVLD